MRRMIDPQTIIKSQIVDDKYEVDLYEILEKYGTKTPYSSKTITLQFYSKEFEIGGGMSIYSDTINKGYIMPNTAITISKNAIDGTVFIVGTLVDNIIDMNLIPYIEIPDGDYENGIIVVDGYGFDIHVIKV